MDIVKQLKKAALFDSTGLFMGAAEEIERLRKALEHIVKRGPDGELWNTADEMAMIARFAFQKKDNLQ